MTSPEVLSANVETMLHIRQVQRLLNIVVVELLRRAEVHDESKMSPEEVNVFAEFTPKLKDCTYNSDEYKGYLAAMKPALDHHYAVSRHHPEHTPEGLAGMSLIDLIEMLADWKAATLRHKDGNLYKSIETNTKRFNISPELRGILEKTAVELGF